LDELAGQAVDRLRTAIQTLIAGVNLPSLQTSIFVNPTRIIPIGLGGFITFNEEPAGDVVGRQVDAIVHVLAGMPSLAELGAAVSALTTALSAAGRKTLMENGIQRLVLDEIGPFAVRANGNGVIVEREIKLSVRFEHVRVPADAGDVIREVEINLGLS
jgi:hypothetical protein